MIRLIELTDEAALRAVFDVGVAAKSWQRPWFRPPPYDGWLVHVRNPDLGTDQELYGVFDGDRCLGTMLIWIPLQDNTDKLYADLDVHPDERGQGVGSALVEHLLRRLAELGRARVLVESFVPGRDFEGHEFSRFAVTRGFRAAWVEVVRHLPLPVRDALVAPPLADGYDVRVFTGRVPEELLPGLAALMRLLAVDAPSGDVEFDAETVSAESLRHTYDREAQQGRIRLSALAIHRPSGDVVAQSDLLLRAEAEHPVVQDGTFVHRDHRGLALGMAVKLANLQELQRGYPGRPYVQTMNAETNAHMVDINVALGFEPVEHLVEWEACR